MSIIYKDYISDLNFNDIYNLLKNKGVELNDVKKAFSSTSYYLLAYDNDKLVGTVRALVDGEEWSIIYDLYAIDKDILKELLKRIINKLGNRHIFTYDDYYGIDFYEEVGFLRTKTAFTYDNENDKAYLPKGFKYESELFNEAVPFPTHHKSNLTNIKIEYKDENNEDYQRINDVLSKAFGRDKNLIETTNDYKNSEYFKFAYVNGELAGVSRAITDHSKNAFILNVGVDPKYQGLRIGNEIVLRLAKDLSKDGYKPFLHTHPGAVGFYNKAGFRRNKYAFEYIREDKPIEMIKRFDLPKGYRFPDEY